MQKFGLIFDVDGVLANTEPYSAQATVDMFRTLYGVEMSPSETYRFVGTCPKTCLTTLASQYGVPLDLPHALSTRLEGFRRLVFEAGASLNFPGTHDLLSAVGADGEWKRGVATTSAHDRFSATLEAVKIPFSWFDTIVTGDMVSQAKPEPEIYHKAARQLGLAEAACVAIEDTPAGLKAAKRAGMKCIAVTNTFDAEDLYQADVVVHSLEDVDVAMLRVLVA